jgi:hypothetical protein
VQSVVRERGLMSRIRGMRKDRLEKEKEEEEEEEEEEDKKRR